MSDPSPAFQLQQFSDLPHFFSVEEQEALEKWGAHAAELTDGTVLPASPKERQFVEVARGESAPVTRFQRIWLRYLQAVRLQESLSEKNSELAKANHQIEYLEGAVGRLEIWGKSAWNQ